ncbi:MAG: hypothetical protein IK066_09895 [Kiritimatiellae bacterium]|nr:hypothetical protein [Kiritimatiellia bacterium]
MKKTMTAAAAAMVLAGWSWGAELLGRVEIRGLETWMGELEATVKGTPLAGSAAMWPMMLDELLGWEAFELLDGEGTVAAEAWGDVGDTEIRGIGVGVSLPAKDAEAVLSALAGAYGDAETGGDGVAEFRARGTVLLALSGADGTVWLGVSDEADAARGALEGIRAGGAERGLSAGGTLAAGFPDVSALERIWSALPSNGMAGNNPAWGTMWSGLAAVSYGVGLGGGVARIEEALRFTESGAERWGLGDRPELGASEAVYAVNLEGALAVAVAKGGDLRVAEDLLAFQQEQWEDVGREFDRAEWTKISDKFRQAGDNLLAVIRYLDGADLGAAWLSGDAGGGAVAMAEGVKGVGEVREWLRAHAETAPEDVARWAEIGDADGIPVAVEWRGEREGPGGAAIDRYAVVLEENDCWEPLEKFGVAFPMDAVEVEVAWTEPGRVVVSTAGEAALDEVLRRAAEGTGRDPRGEAGWTALFGDAADGDGCTVAGWAKMFAMWRAALARVEALALRYGGDEVPENVVEGFRTAAEVLPESDGLWGTRIRRVGALEWRDEMAFGVAEWRRAFMNAYNEGAKRMEEMMAGAIRQAGESGADGGEWDGEDDWGEEEDADAEE